MNRAFMLRSILAMLVLSAWQPAKADQTLVELELVIAVDSSRSIDIHEFALQTGGIAAAFSDPSFHQVLEQTGNGGIAVTYIQWAGRADQTQVVDWLQIADSADAVAFADRVLKAGRVTAPGPTSIGGAIKFGALLLDTNEFEGNRRVIDISGDGYNNTGSRPEIERDRALATGIIINGLTILNESPNLDQYFRRRVIGGHLSFVIATQDFEGYRDAFLRKLIREVRGQIVAKALTD